MTMLRTDTNEQNKALSAIPTIRHPRNVFPLVKKGCTTHQFDILHPIWVKEILPTDSIDFSLEFFSRLQTQITDLFDDLYTDVHVWFCPNRLVQTNWARFFYDSQITGPSQDNSSLTTPAITPFLDGSTYKFNEKDLFDDLELPTEITLNQVDGSPIHIPNYKARHYVNLWNLNYRDQNLQAAVHLDYDDGPDSYADYASHLPRNKRPDMPTTCLPFRQKGTAPNVPVTVSGTIPISTTGIAPAFTQGTNSRSLFMQNGTAGALWSSAPSADGDAAFGSVTGLQVNVSAALASFIMNDVRYAEAVQQYLEANARGGTRDVEALSNIWGCDVDDFRMDRPEYLGGATYRFDGHIVPQTSETGSTPQATLASFSQQRSSISIRHSFVEPGYIMILASHRSNQTYQNILKKEDTRRTRYDFLNPFFVNTGEVSVKSHEINMSSTPAANVNHFGYQRYGYDYVYEMNSVTREMRSNSSNSLDSKHMAYDMVGPATLDDTFKRSQTPIDRNITVSATIVDPIQINFMIQGKIARQIPAESLPGLSRI